MYTVDLIERSVRSGGNCQFWPFGNFSYCRFIPSAVDGETGEGACLRRAVWRSRTQYGYADWRVPTESDEERRSA